MGLYCKKGENSTCQVQAPAGGACERDEECVNTHGCNNNTCTEYFSLLDGTLVVPGKTPNKWSLCASGESGKDNKCRTRTNSVAIENPCTADCSYTDKAANETVVETQSCVCAINKGGLKYCKMANGNFLINHFQDMISSNNGLLVKKP